MTNRARALWYGSAALMLVAGGLLAELISGTLGQVLGFVVLGFGLVLITSLVFLEVGLSEDREREREREVSEREEGEPPRQRRPRRLRPRLPRARGQRRRLG